MNHCESDHEQIMSELKRIQDRMDSDWNLIKASEDDRLLREGIKARKDSEWKLIQFIGFGGAVMLITKLLS